LLSRFIGPGYWPGQSAYSVDRASMKNHDDSGRIAGSFRDPSGFLFHRDGVLYRQVNSGYRDHYDLLMGSGLYQKLTEQGLLIPHEEVDIRGLPPAGAYKIIRPDLISFISYPYGWCFSQLKAAALLTLEVERIALEHGMTLKDCSAYNVQFQQGRPIFIDTLSFKRYVEGQPWAAYRQFCQHFLAPLALMSHKDICLSQLLRIYIDGIPLDLASKLLPAATLFSPALLAHIHLHAKSQERYGGRKVDVKGLKLSRLGLYGIVDQLTSAVRGLKWRPHGTAWAGYYNDTNYTDAALKHKQELVEGYLDRLKPGTVWDLGANTGLFSRIAGRMGAETVAFDIDPTAVELNYLECVKEGDKNILPLVVDLVNPSPGLGWENSERLSLIQRGPADTVLALALVHHLAITSNVPLVSIASFFSSLCRSLIVEFVPKNDSQVERLLTNREDIFTDYTQQGFEAAFMRYFTIEDSQPIRDSQRILYLMRVRE